jgi:flavin-dependent dehydrogenase
MKYYDVVIIGAGPGGLKCAEILSKSDKRVLLLEKNSEIGPKVCAGGLINDSVRHLNFPDNIFDREFNSITINSKNKKTIIKKNEPIVCTIDRKNLGQYQLGLIEKNKVEIKMGTVATEINKEFLIINNNEKIFFKYLVGADGSLSIVRKYLGLNVNRFLLAIQYILPLQKQEKMEIYFNSDSFYSWYGWIFPHKDYISIGCGCDPKLYSTKKLILNFKKWLKKKDIDVGGRELQSFVINCDCQGHKFDNFYLIGDAAGLASYLTGEGIYEALASGEEVAKEILDHQYHSKIIDELIEKTKKHYRIFTIINNFKIFKNLSFEMFVVLMKNKTFSNYVLSLL